MFVATHHTDPELNKPKPAFRPVGPKGSIKDKVDATPPKDKEAGYRSWELPIIRQKG